MVCSVQPFGSECDTPEAGLLRTLMALGFPVVIVAALSKIEQAKAERCGLDLAPHLAELAAQGWDNLDEADLTIRLKWLGIFFRPVTPGRFMVRLRLPNGVINADQLDVLADAVDRCGDEGSADITTRQNIQLRGLLLEDMAPLLAAMETVGLTSRQSGHDNPRNITGNPFAGIDPEELVDTRPLVAAIQELLLREGPRNLPRKFNIAWVEPRTASCCTTIWPSCRPSATGSWVSP